jgi:hypothetical protein
MTSGSTSVPDIRPIPSGDEGWAVVVHQAASKVGSAAELEASLRHRYPEAVVHASGLDGLARPIWYVYRRGWFQRR